MAYQAIVDGARGLMFFGGHMTEVATPADARPAGTGRSGSRCCGRSSRELTSTASCAPALVAPDAKATVNGIDRRHRARHARTHATFLYVIAVRRGGTTSRVTSRGCRSRRSA